MFDLGWQEFLMVAVVLMLVVGPKDMPRILRSFSKMARRARAMAHEFTSTLEDAAKDTELQDVKNMMQDVKSGDFDDMTNLIGGDLKDIASDIKDTSGLGQVQEEVSELQQVAQKTAPKPASKKKAVQKPTAKKASKTAAKKPAKKTAKKTAKKKVI